MACNSKHLVRVLARDSRSLSTPNTLQMPADSSQQYMQGGSHIGSQYRSPFYDRCLKLCDGVGIFNRGRISNTSKTTVLGLV